MGLIASYTELKTKLDIQRSSEKDIYRNLQKQRQNNENTFLKKQSERDMVQGKKKV